MMMTINSKKIFGMLFVGLAILIANPSLGWAEEKKATEVLENQNVKISDLDYSSYLKETVIQTDPRGGVITYEVENPRFVATRKSLWNQKSKELGRELTQAEKDKYEKIAAKSIGATLAAEKAERLTLEKLVKETGEKNLFESTDNVLKDLEESDDPADKEKAAQIRAAGAKAKADTKASQYGGADAVIYTDAKGTEYKYSIKNGQASYTKGALEGCQALPVKIYEQRKCFFCPLFAVIYRAADNMAVLGFSRLASPFAALLALGLGLYIAFQTLTHVSSLTKQDAPKFLGTLIRQTFKFLIAFLLLQYAGQIYLYVVNPILSAGLAFGSSLLTQATPCESGEAMKTVYYSSSLYTQLECFITNVQKEIAFMQSIGSSLICIGGNAMLFQGKTIDFGDGFWMVLQGVLIGGFGFLLSLAFAFYLIDAVVQLGIVGALMPFLIASWPFKLTAQYTSKGFSMILNSFFVFVFIGLVVSVNLQLIDAAMENGAQSAQTEDKKASLSIGGTSVEINDKMGALQKIYDAINEQKEEELQKLTDISGAAFIILLICCIFGFKFCAQSSTLAEKMASGGLKGIGAGIGTMAASTAVGLTKKATQPTRQAIADKTGDLVKRAPAAIGGAVVSRFKKIKNNLSNSGEKEEEAPASTSTPASTPTPVTLRSNQQTSQQEINSTDENEKRAVVESNQNKNTTDQLKNEFANTNLGKTLNEDIKATKDEERNARIKEKEAGNRADTNSKKLKNMDDKNSPEAKALEASINNDREEEKKAQKEANAAIKKGKTLQTKKNAAEKGYVKSRKNGANLEKADKDANTTANSFDDNARKTKEEKNNRENAKKPKKRKRN